MHELGIVSGILETVTAAAHEAGASRVVAVSLRIGDLREVVPDSLDFAWEVLTEEDSLTEGCALNVEEIHPRSRCQVCGEEFDHDRFHLRCPVCGSRDTHLLRGRELDLVSMEIENDDDESDAVVEGNDVAGSANDAESVENADARWERTVPMRARRR